MKVYVILLDYVWDEANDSIDEASFEIKGIYADENQANDELERTIRDTIVEARKLGDGYRQFSDKLEYVDGTIIAKDLDGYGYVRVHVRAYEVI